MGNHVLRSVLLLGLGTACAASSSAVPANLAGVWTGQRILGPALQGPILVRRDDSGLWAEVGPYRTPIETEARALTFRLPNGARFEGALGSDNQLSGFWFQQPSRLDTNVFASPVRFQRLAGGWRGTIQPVRDTGTLRLIVVRTANEGLAATLINPERNLGVFDAVTRIAVVDREVQFWGTNRGRGDERILLRGRYHPKEGILSLRYPWRGGSYDLSRHFNTKMGAAVLVPPPDLDDGWQVGRPSEVGMNEAPIVALIEQLRAPVESARALRVHSMLVARHGRLVVERYFRGFHRDKVHDSRSASKTIGAVFAAAVMHAGYPLTWDTAVYPLFARNDDPRRAKITIAHLANMSSGLDCDDNNPNSAANEGRLWDNAKDLDFYEHLLGVDVVRPPGAVAVYCSAGSNLLAASVAAAAKERLLPLLERTVMAPMGIEKYGVVVPPDGHPYFGGGVRLRARDFLKFPQMLLDGGIWNGRRVIAESEARRLITPAVKIKDRDYGWQVWTADYPYQGRTVRAHFLAGNGGQIAMLVPELSLTIAFNAGNYGDRVMLKIQNELIPQVILPAIR